jgi:hypothetical protein
MLTAVSRLNWNKRRSFATCSSEAEKLFNGGESENVEECDTGVPLPTAPLRISGSGGAHTRHLMV